MESFKVDPVVTHTFNMDGSGTNTGIFAGSPFVDHDHSVIINARHPHYMAPKRCRSARSPGLSYQPEVSALLGAKQQRPPSRYW